MSFEDYVRSRTPGLVRFASVLTGGDGHLAEDVVQEVLLRACRQWDHVQASQSPEAYIRRMVVNEYLSWRRKWARIIPRSDVGMDRATDDHSERYVDQQDLAERLRRLSPNQRAVLVLRFYEDLPDAEIAEILGCSSTTVRSHASRALTTLRVESGQTALAPVRKEI